MFRHTLASAACFAGIAAACAEPAIIGVQPGSDASDDTLFLDGSACSDACSSDLKTIVDCRGGIVRVCEDGKACVAGQCVSDDPCKVAAQNQTSYGCDFFALEIDNNSSYWLSQNITAETGGCFTVFVANTWSTPVHLSLEKQDGSPTPLAPFTRVPKGQGGAITYTPYDDKAGLAPGDVAILFLADALTGGTSSEFSHCPSGITPLIQGDAAINGTAIGKAFHISTDKPVTAYQEFPYSGAVGSGATNNVGAMTSATLLLPTHVWGTNYVAVQAWAPAPDVKFQTYTRPSLDLIAMSNATTVTIKPVADIFAGNGVGGTTAGKPVSYTLQRGQYLQITQIPELTGSIVSSDKPIGLIGASISFSPDSDYGASTGQQQIVPVKAAGHEYVGVRYRDRLGAPENSPWRLIGMIAGTKLAWEPLKPLEAPDTLGPGQVAEFHTTQPFVVRSQDSEHPFLLAAYMQNIFQLMGTSPGAPEFVMSVPTDQYLHSYDFFTDPTFPETDLVLVRRKGVSGQFENVVLDCAGPIDGWTSIGSYEYARPDLSTGDYQAIGKCSNGRHTMYSTAPFAVTVWGWTGNQSCLGSCNGGSYAYPGGLGITPINAVVLPPN